MQTEASGRPLRLWAVSDGRAGNAAQALGLAEALARRRPVTLTEVRVEPARWAALVPPRAWRALGLGSGDAGEWRDLALPGPPWPDLAIGAGRRAAPLVAWLRRHGVKTVQLLDPRMGGDAFDMVVVPRHDRLSGANVLATIGSVGRMTAGRIAAEAARWRARLDALPRPRLAVLIGGSSRSARWGADTPDRLVEALAQLQAQSHGLMATPSRRTPGGLVERLSDTLGSSAFVWDGRGDNPYPAILGLADAVLVTEDSVNMASEAASTGAPVHLFPVGRVRPKMRRFQQDLIARGAARPFAGRIEDWRYQPLDEVARVAAEVETRLLSP